jgi:hypothetical protein
MIFAAMVENVMWESGVSATRKITVSIIDLATKWKIQSVSYLPTPSEDEIQYHLAETADKCALAYGYFLATV